jgi:hypothetical protein
MRPRSTLIVVGAVLLAGCGGSSKPSPTSSTTSATTTAATTISSPTTPSQASPLQAEANSAATGDIPDNQVFLVFRNTKAGYSMKYPEGWAQQGTGAQVVFRDKNNIVRTLVSSALVPTLASARTGVSGLKVTRQPAAMKISGAPAIEVVYRTQSAPNSVTGKRVALTVDRYYLWHGGKVATVDLGTSVGVDNVDAYRLMIQSFRWR